MDGAMMLPEFDHEFAETRKSLERVPEEKFDWKPHAKSWSLHELAAHCAEVPQWVGPTLMMDGFDLDAPHERIVPKTKAEILAHFDEGVAAAREIIEGTTGDALGQIWTMTKGGKVELSMPKGAVLRSFIFSHNVHHRAQTGRLPAAARRPGPGALRTVCRRNDGGGVGRGGAGADGRGPAGPRRYRPPFPRRCWLRRPRLHRTFRAGSGRHRLSTCDRWPPIRQQPHPWRARA